MYKISCGYVQRRKDQLGRQWQYIYGKTIRISMFVKTAISTQFFEMIKKVCTFIPNILWFTVIPFLFVSGSYFAFTWVFNGLFSTILAPKPGSGWDQMAGDIYVSPPMEIYGFPMVAYAVAIGGFIMWYTFFCIFPTPKMTKSKISENGDMNERY